DQSDLAALHAAGALQRPQRMRHAYAREDEVVPALRTRGIAVEGAQESIDVVHASGAQVMGLGACNDGEVRRSSTKPLGSVFLAHGDFDEIAYALAGEQQVALDLLFGQADVRQAVVAQILRAVAAKTVVVEELGTVLQRCHVIDTYRRLFQRVPAFSRNRDSAGQGESDGSYEFLNHDRSVTL